MEVIPRYVPESLASPPPPPPPSPFALPLPLSRPRSLCLRFGRLIIGRYSPPQALVGKMVAHVACGGFHSAAILESGELYTWGGGEHGQVCFGLGWVGGWVGLGWGGLG